MRKFFAFVIILALAIIFIPWLHPARAADMSDITGHWAAQFITQATDAGIVKGYPDGTFKPENSITRAEFVTMLARCPESNATVVSQAYDIQNFRDVKGHWAVQYLAGAVKDGVLNGFEDGTLRPDDTITREQVATILSRKTPNAQKAFELPYVDSHYISLWAWDGVRMMYQVGVMKGDDKGFRPQDNLTRAEAAKVLVEWRKWRPHADEQPLPPGVPAGSRIEHTPDGGGWTDTTPATPVDWVETK